MAKLVLKKKIPPLNVSNNAQDKEVLDEKSQNIRHLDKQKEEIQEEEKEETRAETPQNPKNSKKHPHVGNKIDLKTEEDLDAEDFNTNLQLALHKVQESINEAKQELATYNGSTYTIQQITALEYFKNDCHTKLTNIKNSNLLDLGLNTAKKELALEESFKSLIKNLNPRDLMKLKIVTASMPLSPKLSKALEDAYFKKFKPKILSLFGGRFQKPINNNIQATTEPKNIQKTLVLNKEAQDSIGGLLPESGTAKTKESLQKQKKDKKEQTKEAEKKEEKLTEQPSKKTHLQKLQEKREVEATAERCR